MTPQSFEILATLLRNGSGLVIGPDKLYLLETRLTPLLRAHQITDLDALAGRLRSGAPTIERDVIEAMTTNESSFFRDDKPFTHVRTQALPRLHSTRPPGAKIRIWSAAASTGQEAYSLAMVIAESRATLGNREFEIVGTDIAREPLGRAREGLYTQFEVQRGLPVAMLVKYFSKDGANWRIADQLRKTVTFKEWNLLGDLRPLGMFDLVFCRNVLIYFDPPTKAKALEAIAKQMAPDALLFLGGAETVLGVTEKFAPLHGDRGVYTLAGTPPLATTAPASIAARPQASAAGRRDVAAPATRV
jgi:chemotaxis protein methyltransferase CheR